MARPAQPLPDRRAARPIRPRLALHLRVWAVCGCSLLASWTAGLAQDSVSTEYKVKAAYLYNFAKFVKWPAQGLTNSDSPLVIGVFGQNPFGQELAAIARDHQINGRPILIKPVASVADAAGVHLMFIGATEDAQATQILTSLKDANILTVGESKKYAAAGGIIDFVREADKVRFEINETAAEHHGIKISAQLLKLARSVQKESPP
jgi:hypothetical protein